MSGPQSDNWRASSDWRSSSRPVWRQDRDPHQQNQRPRQPNNAEQQSQRRQQADGDGNAAESIREGRRIYLGNLLYRVQPQAVQEMLEASGFEGLFEAIHISMDAVSGRNPGYCFIDFKTREDANLALESLNGVTILDRPVKVGPCQPKTRARAHEYQPTFQRWGDWVGSERRSSPGDTSAASQGGKKREQGPYAALDHLKEVERADTPPRVYVGGIGKMVNQEENDKEIRGYFEGFQIVAISKRITPHPDTRLLPGNHHYCFVDFETVEEAKAAIQALNGRPVVGGKLRLGMAKVLPEALR